MTIQDIKQKLPMSTVLSHYGLVVDRNKRLCCPFHDDKKPSMQVYEKDQSVHCFSSNCKVHGKQIDVIDFVMHQENLSKHQAILKCKQLIGAAIVTIPQVSEKERIQILTSAFAYFRKAYAKSEAAQKYMQSRSLEKPGKEVGYHDGKLSKSLQARLLKLDIQPGWGVDCVIFPLKNASGEIVSLYGRSITNNHDQRHFYSKNRQGLYPHYPDPKTTQYLILTESVLDAASLPLPRDTAVLALYGTNGLTVEHKKAVAGLDLLHEMILFFDGDEAGCKAMRVQADELWKCWIQGGQDQKVKKKITGVPTPMGEDINSILQGHGDVSVFFHLLNQRRALGSGAKVAAGTTPAPSKAPQFKFDTSNPKKLTLHTTNATYQLQGKPKPELDTMRVTLFIYNKNGGKSRHKLDLFEDRQSEKCAREASEKLSLPYEILLLDLNTLADALEHYRDQELQELQQAQRKENQPAVLTPALQKECLELLKSPDLMDKLGDKIGLSGVVGEEMNRLLLFCVASSYKMPKTLHAIVQGSSGSGKTHLLNAVLELMPPEELLNVTRITDKSLYNYGKYALRNKLFVIQDLDGLSEEALLAFRELISYEKVASSTTGQDKNGQIGSYVKEVYGPVASMTATTQTEVYEDNENRCFTLAVNEGEAQTQAIIDYMNACSIGTVNWSNQQYTKHVFRNCVRMLQPYEVVNAYADQLSLPDGVHKARRLHSLYQALVKQITLLHQFQRKKDAQGRLITTKTDLHWANTILFETIILRIDELDGELRQFFENLKSYCSEDGVKHEFTRREVRQRFRISSTSLHRYIRKLLDLEYIKQVGGYVNKGWSYRIIYWDDIQALRAKVQSHLDDQLRNLKTS